MAFAELTLAVEFVAELEVELVAELVIELEAELTLALADEALFGLMSKFVVARGVEGCAKAIWTDAVSAINPASNNSGDGIRLLWTRFSQLQKILSMIPLCNKYECVRMV